MMTPAYPPQRPAARLLAAASGPDVPPPRLLATRPVDLPPPVTMALVSGEHLTVTQPEIELITVDVVAHALATINRYNGHALRPCSVAEHSLLVAEIAERELRAGPWVQLAALLHDAHEAITGDITQPVQEALRRMGSTALDDLKGAHQHAAWRAMGLPVLNEGAFALIHQADMMALATERRDLLHPKVQQTAWPCLLGVQPVDWIRLDSPERAAMSWADWRDRWLDHHDALVAQLQGLLDGPQEGQA